jgi:hypothetical protein
MYEIRACMYTYAYVYVCMGGIYLLVLLQGTVRTELYVPLVHLLVLVPSLLQPVDSII